MSERSRVHVVVFDLDGTLVDTMDAIPRVYVETVTAQGGPTISIADVIAAWSIGATPAVLSHFLDRPTTADDLACFFEHSERAASEIQPFEGVDPMLAQLRSDGYRLAICTSAMERLAALMLRATGLEVWFREVVAGDHVAAPKPAPHGLNLVCRRLGVRPSSVAYVGDQDVDIESARSAGVAAIRAAWGCSTADFFHDEAVAATPASVPLVLHHLATGR